MPLIDATSADAPVTRKVFAESSPAQVSVAGENVTPLTGVGVKVPTSTPLGRTVKSPEAVLA